MKKILSFLGGLCYSVVVSYLMWLLFYFVTPFLMRFGWKALVLYLVLAAGTIPMLFIPLFTYAWAPVILLIRNCKAVKFVSAIPLLLFGYSAVADVWRLSIVYSGSKVAIAIAVSVMIATFFISLIKVSLSYNE